MNISVEIHKRYLVKINPEKVNQYLIGTFGATPAWCTGYQLNPYGLIYIKYRDLIKQGFSVPDFTDELCNQLEEEPLVAFDRSDLDFMTE